VWEGGGKNADMVFFNLPPIDLLGRKNGASKGEEEKTAVCIRREKERQGEDAGVVDEGKGDRCCGRGDRRAISNKGNAGWK